MTDINDDKVINALLTGVGRSAPASKTVSDKRFDRLWSVWRPIRRQVILAFWWVALHTWKRPAIGKGKSRWKQLAGISHSDENTMHLHRAQKTGTIYYPTPTWENRAADCKTIVSGKMAPRPDVE